jgi:hypothetical protein
MANTINWGKIYCSSYWGDTANTTDAIPVFSAPLCWTEDILELSCDSTSFSVDSTLITVDQTRI